MRFKKFLLEEYDHNSTQAPVPETLKRKIASLRGEISTGDLDPDEGLEKDPHITVRYGLHKHEPEKVKEIVGNTGPVDAEIEGIGIFKNDEHDVLVLKIYSPGLRELNRKLGELPNTKTHSVYRPHLTLAYLKKGAGEKYKEMEDLKGERFKVDVIHCTNKDGEKTPVRL